MNKHTSLAVLLCAAVLTACGTKQFQDITSPPAQSKIRFFNFGVNAPGVNFYANTTKMTAISSTSGVESTTGVVYGAGGVSSTGYYTAIAPGSYTFSGNIAAATDKDLAISKVTSSLTAGSAYSFYMSGFYDATAKSVEGFVVADNYPATIDWTQSYVRFVNAVSNANPMVLYAKNQTTTTESAVGAATAYKAAGAFVAIPSGVYDLTARFADQTTAFPARIGVSFVAGKVYTVSALGDITVQSTTLTNRARLDNTANR
ncbi:MAG: DUF4397 domain-containing protein [Gemmatimonadetes bacterium]|nr:DUF4397 domain-containing protein [Gemmatimonadota bacterium]